MCPITAVPEGREVTVALVAGGSASSRRLTELGLVPGRIVAVMQNSGGPLLLRLGDSRFALGKGVAEKVFVKED